MKWATSPQRALALVEYAIVPNAMALASVCELGFVSGHGPNRAVNNLYMASVSGKPIQPSLAAALGTQSLRHEIRLTHWLRQEGASKGSAKYCVSCTTLPLRNSIMLTV
jgi:hypothetical protein